MSRLRSCMVILGIGATAIFAAPPSKSTSTVHKQTKRTEQLIKQLDKIIPKVQFDEMELSEALKWFQKQGIKNMIVRWPAIERGGISRETEISLQLSDMTLGELLDFVLEVASYEVADRDGELTYVIRKGVVQISTRADFGDEYYTRVYDIAALIHPVMNRDVGSAGGGSRYTEDGRRIASPNVGARQAKAGRLMEVLESIRPETWVSGGGYGRAVQLGNKLVITQTIEMHEIIGGTFRENHGRSRDQLPAPTASKE